MRSNERHTNHRLSKHLLYTVKEHVIFSVQLSTTNPYRIRHSIHPQRVLSLDRRPENSNSLGDTLSGGSGAAAPFRPPHIWKWTPELIKLRYTESGAYVNRNQLFALLDWLWWDACGVPVPCFHDLLHCNGLTTPSSVCQRQITVITRNQSALAADRQPRQQSGQSIIRQIYDLARLHRQRGNSVNFLWIGD